MNEVVLHTADDKLVARVMVPPFVTPPRVVLWGERLFVLLDGVGGDDLVYAETVPVYGFEVRPSAPPVPSPPPTNPGRGRPIVQPIVRGGRQLIGGGDPDDPAHRELKPGGQQKDYVVLSPKERAKGFVRPVRRTYLHAKCGAVTTMGTALAETYARDPGFYSGTFCAACGDHFPVGATGEFTWDGTDEKVGT